MAGRGKRFVVRKLKNGVVAEKLVIAFFKKCTALVEFLFNLACRANGWLVGGSQILSDDQMHRDLVPCLCHDPD